MRQIAAAEVTALVADLYLRANFELPGDVVAALRQALEDERSEVGRDVLKVLLENVEIAKRKRVPLCQDTGLAVVFAEIGGEVAISGATLQEAVDAGIARAVRDGHLRASVVSSPCFGRQNTGNNNPAMLHTEIVGGDSVLITVLPKGAGSENMSRLGMLKPADGVEGVKSFVLETVRAAGASPCPPIIIGIGIGGAMDTAALLSKRALLRPLGEPHSDPALASLERELLDEINRLGIGPAGLGGSVTCLGVAIEDHPCHIASLPVAVNIQCNSARRASGRL